MTFAIGASDATAAWNVLLMLQGSSSLYLSHGESVRRSFNGSSYNFISYPMKFGDLREDFTDGLVRGIRVSALDLTIYDNEGQDVLTWFIANNYGVGRRVRVLLSKSDAADSDLAFDGVVKEASDASYDHERMQLKLRLMDRRTAESVRVPDATFDPSDSDFEYIDQQWRNRAIPILIGDWSENVVVHPAGIRRPIVEAVAIDTGVHKGRGQYAMEFQICDPGENGIAYIGDEVWIKYANPAAHLSDDDRPIEWSKMTISTTTLASARFTVDTTEIEDQTYRYFTGDKFYVYCKGLANGAGTVIQNPMLVLRELFNAYASPQTDNDDWPSVATGYLNFTTRKARAYITDEIDLAELADRLCSEFGMIWGVEPYDDAGTQDSVYWAGQLQPWNTATLNEPTADYKPVWGNLSAEPLNEPEVVDLYADYYKVRFSYLPITDDWLHRKNINVSGLRYLPWSPGGAAYITREIDSTFIWKSGDVRKMVDLQAKLYAKKREVWTLKAWGWPLTRHLADVIEWIGGDDDDDRRGIIVGRRANMATGACELRVLDCTDRYDYYGRWTEDAEDIWDDQDAAGRKTWGFWTNDDGECDPGNANSEDSKWV